MITGPRTSSYGRFSNNLLVSASRTWLHGHTKSSISTASTGAGPTRGLSPTTQAHTRTPTPATPAESPHDPRHHRCSHVRGQSHHRARSDQNRRPHPGHTHTIPNNGGGNKHRCTAERVTNLPNPAGPAPPPTPPPPPHDPRPPPPPSHTARNNRRTRRRKSSSRKSAAADPAETHD